jgi:D-alanyl-lipoteichoic acid acyltransferase DltB (MBOAT superfamily)
VLFNSLEFFAFFFVVYALYLVLQHRLQNALLLAASYFFYGYTDVRFLLLLVASNIVDFSFGLALSRASTPRRKCACLVVSVVANLAFLGLFKYFNFFAENVGLALGSFGITADWRLVNLVLPVGISFYTLQSMSYIIDVYRGRLPATKSFVDFALYVTFFPQLVAGPIERAANLLPQLGSKRAFRIEDIQRGLFYILYGLFQKVVVADNMQPYFTLLTRTPGESRGLELLLCLYASWIMIYADFCGYSNLAKGLASCFGIRLSSNFARPIFATGPRDFWRRWHITLSSWTKDYVYVPLMSLPFMKKIGPLADLIAVSVTMLAIGLWHGASWNFVIWGALCAFLIIFYRVLAWANESLLPAPLAVPSPIARLIYFHAYTLTAGVFFLVTKLALVPTVYQRMLGTWEWNGAVCLMTILAFAGPMFVFELAQERRGEDFHLSWGPWARRLAYSGMFMLIMLSGVTGAHEFVYFQF